MINTSKFHSVQFYNTNIQRYCFHLLISLYYMESLKIVLKAINVNNPVDKISLYHLIYEAYCICLIKLNVMTNRTKDLVQMRPIIPSALIYKSMSSEERFQNATLRPLLVLQNELLIEVFKNYIAKHKNVFNELHLPKQLDYIENAIHKDMKFRNSIKGMIIGQFTVEEYGIYIQNSSALNKRMMNLVKERLISQIQLFAPQMATVI